MASCDGNRSSHPREKTIVIAGHFGEEFAQATQHVADLYTQEHPDILVKVINRPPQGYDTWVETQLVARRPPDIFHSHYMNEFRKRDLVISLDDHLEQTNKHTGKKWRDQFVPGILDRYSDEIHRVNMIPSEVRGYGFYYNQNIFHQAEAEPPKTWAELMRVCAKIKQAGFIPIACSGRIEAGDFAWFVWGLRGLQDMLLRHLQDEVVLYERDPNWTMDLADPWNDTSLKVSMEDIMLAFVRGTFSPLKNEDWGVCAKLLKALVPYYPPGFAGMTLNEAKDLFVTQKAAIIYFDTAFAYELNDSLQELKASGRDFAVGVFPWPVLTRETIDRPHLSPPRGQIEVGKKWNVAKSTTPRQAQAVDFLRFMLKKQNIEYIQSHQTNPNLPATLDAEAQAGISEYRQVWLEHGISMIAWLFTTFNDREAEDKFQSNMQIYLLDSISLDELLTRADAQIIPLLRRSVKKFDLNVAWVKQQLEKNNEPVPAWLTDLE